MSRNAHEQLTSFKNPTLQRVRKLINRRARDESGTFRIEGAREIKLAIDGGIEFELVLYCDSASRFEANEPLLERIEAVQAPSIYDTPANVFNRLSQFQNPDGLLVVARQWDASLARLNGSKDGIYLVVDGVEKPGNLGNMLRTADATGCNGVVVTDPSLDLCNPNVIRASLGTVFTVPCAIASTAAAVRWMKDRELRIVATSPQGVTDFLEADLAAGCAIVIGSEKDGLSDHWLNASDCVVRLPNLGQADSLNAAMTATAMLFESYRQRNAADPN